MNALIPFFVGVFFVQGAMAEQFKVTSPEIKEGSRIADEQVFNGFGCQGSNISPVLNWSGAPVGTKSYTTPTLRRGAGGGTGWCSTFLLA